MSELFRLVLLLGVAAAAVTFLTALAAQLMTEERRFGRAFRKVLGDAPEAAIIGRGTGRAAALGLASGQIAVSWGGGGWCLIYGVQELIGAELALNGQIAARVLRGEPRRALDRTAHSAGEVRLRLLFDDALNPDFEITLWPPPRARDAVRFSGAEALSEANRWLARIEALLRRTGQGPARAEATTPRTARPPVRQTEDLFEFDEEEPPF